MSGTDLNVRVKELIIGILNLDIGPDDIDDEQSLINGSLGLDSVLTLELTFSLEDEFGIEISDEELVVELFDNVSSLVGFVQSKLNQNIL